MGVPTSEVGYTSAMPRREDHDVHKDMCGIGGEEDPSSRPDPRRILSRNKSDV